MVPGTFLQGKQKKCQAPFIMSIDNKELASFNRKVARNGF